MEKYGVDTGGKDTKTAAEKAASRCPTCGAGLTQNTNVPKCPSCGTKPFEPSK